MTEESPLKKQSAGKLFSFILFNSLLWSIVTVLRGENAVKLREFWADVQAEDGLIMVLAPVITIVLNGILPSSIKYVLVFWRIKHPLPGSRAFSELAHADSRINLYRLKKKYGVLPTLASEQNRLWYRIYKSHEGKPSVLDAHINFLLTRDLCAISAMFMMLSTVFCISKSCVSKLLLPYVLFLVAQYIVTAIAARNYGNRLVCNVLAEESVN